MISMDGWRTIPRPIRSFLIELRSKMVGEPNAPAARITVFANKTPGLQLLPAQPLLTDPGKTRVVLLCRVVELHAALPLLGAGGLVIEHLYDY
jgi:hypothetical protein